METNVIESTAVPAEQMSLASILRIPAVRQVLLLVGIAAAVAAGLAVAMWSRSPGYSAVYTDMDATEAAEVSAALRAADIDYKLGPNGNVLVPQALMHEARMQLASQGFAGDATSGMSVLNEGGNFGRSQLVETAMYQHALEQELSRTISSLGSVREARVHLALPKETSFIRSDRQASASVMLKMYRGRVLEDDQAAAIVNLVASSVPRLSPSDVTVVDQFGRMLSSGDEQSASMQAASQFKIARGVEQDYKNRIEQLLTPLVGPGRVRAEVSANIDFTVSEEASESYDPATTLRSEQTSETSRVAGGEAAGGVPGALSNQPPEGAESADAATATVDGNIVPQRNTTRDATRNYEVDRTVVVSKQQSGTIESLSVAVLIDNSPVQVQGEEGADDAAAAPSLTEADIERYTDLVKSAVGFDELRGDSVTVMTEAFLATGPAAEIEPPAIWERPLVQDIAKQALGALLVLAIAFGVVRPMLRGVVASSATVSADYAAAAALPGGGAAGGTGTAMQVAGAPAAQLALPSFDEKVAAAKNITGHDPARVAQVVKQWVSADDG